MIDRPAALRFPPLRRLVCAAVAVCLPASVVCAADAPAVPPVSSFAPLADLEAIVADLVQDNVPRAKDEAAYKSGQQQIARDANTLLVLAAALAQHDGDSPAKARAGALAAAANDLTQAVTQAEAHAALTALEAAVKEAAKPGAAAPAGWETGASQDQLMKQVTFLQNKIKRGAKGSRFASTAEESAKLATVLAVIAQAVQFDTVGIEPGEKLSQWQQFCGQMRDAATAVHNSLAAKDATAVAAALDRLEQSCTACHKVFRPDLP